MASSLIERNGAWASLVRLYGEAGMKDACLTLQDRAGVCVTALLTLVWSAAAGHGPVRPETAAAVVAVSEGIEADVLRPLRRARDGLRRYARRDDEAAALRRELLRRELDVERFLQERVLECIRPAGRRDHARDAEGDAHLAMDRYLECMGVPITPPLHEPLRRVVAVAVSLP